MKIYPVYIIAIFLIIPLIYLLRRRNEQNKTQTNYLLIIIFTLLLNNLGYSYSLYNFISLDIYYSFIIRIIHFIFVYKYIASFQKEKPINPLYLYSPLVFFSALNLINFSGYYIFDNEYLHYTELNSLDLNIVTFNGSKDLFIATVFVQLFFILIISKLVKEVLRKLVKGKKKFKAYRDLIVLLYLYVLSSSLSLIFSRILLALDLNFTVLFIFTKLLFLLSVIILMLFPKYASHSISFKHENIRLKSSSDEKNYLRIVDILQKTQMFLKPEKNLSHLAINSKLNSKLIIKLIYDFESLSVTNYLIKLRIKYAKQKIAEGYLYKFSIEALLLESGFKSPQTFYRNFKKFEGITPKEYHNSLR
jgi:AraC-like DNA-binding protein